MVSCVVLSAVSWLWVAGGYSTGGAQCNGGSAVARGPHCYCQDIQIYNTGQLLSYCHVVILSYLVRFSRFHTCMQTDH